ncbi:hypothetical protein ATERTT37_000630 [Aspergillus terreus]
MKIFEKLDYINGPLFVTFIKGIDKANKFTPSKLGGCATKEVFETVQFRIAIKALGDKLRIIEDRLEVRVSLKKL